MNIEERCHEMDKARMKLTLSPIFDERYQRREVRMRTAPLVTALERSLFGLANFSDIYEEKMQDFTPKFGVGKPERINEFMMRIIVDKIDNRRWRSFQPEDPRATFLFWYDFYIGVTVLPVYLEMGLERLMGEQERAIGEALKADTDWRIRFGLVNSPDRLEANTIANYITGEKMRKAGEYAERKLIEDNNGIGLVKGIVKMSERNPQSMPHFNEGTQVPRFYSAGVKFSAWMYQRVYELTPEQVQ